MFSRYFFLLFAVVLAVAVVNVAAQSVEEEDDLEVELDDVEFDDSSLTVEERSKIGRKIEKILRKFFKNATEKCLKEAIKKCKKHWYNPSKLIKCAKDLFSIETLGCAIGV